LKQSKQYFLLITPKEELMKIDTLHFKNDTWLIDTKEPCNPDTVDIVFVFGDIIQLKEYDNARLLKQKYPNAHIVGASTAGNILDDELSEYSAVAAAVSFDKGHVLVKQTSITDKESLYDTSAILAQSFPKDKLKHLFVLADGLKINGSELVRALNDNLDVSVTGGLAGDAFDFADHTLVFADAPAQEKAVVAVGFYGDSIHTNIGCKAGWQEFGAERIVTRAEGNIIYEIDNKPALDLYEAYLGEYIKDLPASGLLFPLNIREYEGDHEVIRVMMGINEDKSLIFAGDIPQGSTVRLMKTNIDNLIDGASLVANAIQKHNNKPALALTVSCSGRRSVLKQLVDEELDAIHRSLNEHTQIVGFYSYGEIAPFSDDVLDCKLHNQTITLTVVYED